jgi:FHS family L-fucose permease-like MFS transporter
MFPTIFALSIKISVRPPNVAFLLVMAIIGGAFPGDHGHFRSSSIQKAFIVPLLCYVFILYFGLSGYKPARTPAMEPVSVGNGAIGMTNGIA